MRPSHGDHTAVVDDANAVCILSLIQLMRGQADGDVVLLAQITYVLP